MRHDKIIQQRRSQQPRHKRVSNGIYRTDGLTGE